MASPGKFTRNPAVSDPQRASPEAVRNLLDRLSWIALVALAAVVFMGKSYERSLQAMDSSIHARVALQVTRQGPLPALPMGRSGEEGASPVFNDHPFTLFYINGWIERAFGADAWSARLLPSAFAVGCVLLVAWLGRLLYSPDFPAVGMSSAFVLIVNRELISYGARFQLDPAMIFFVLLSFIAWWKRRPVWTGIAAGAGMWMKNPVSFLIFPSAFSALLLTGGMRRRELGALILAFCVAVPVGSAVWVVSGIVGGWGMVSDYWSRQVFGTAVGGRGHIQHLDLLMGLDLIWKTYWPWLPLLLASTFLIVRDRRWTRPEVALPFSAALTVLVVISLMRFKFSHYYLPMYPFLALLTTDGLRGWIEARRQGIAVFLIGSAMILPAFLLAMPVELSPEMFPALRRFDALIQSYGSCGDKVLFVEGQQPYGSFSDYSVEIGFYANRRAVNAGCADANAAVARENPAWILVAGSNLRDCLDERVRHAYPVRYRFGNQYLLSSVIPLRDALDLTPLARSLRAPLDCAPVPLPQDRYHRYE